MSLADDASQLNLDRVPRVFRKTTASLQHAILAGRRISREDAAYFRRQCHYAATGRWDFSTRHILEDFLEPDLVFSSYGTRSQARHYG